MNEYLEYAKSRPGQVGNNECERLSWLASQVESGGLIVEIGAYKGKSAAAFISGMYDDTIRLVSIDPWCLQGKTPQGYETLETIGDYRKSIERRKQQVTQIIGWPVEVARFWNAEIDLLFVDATKTYESINEIWRAWLPFCRGWVASHDYRPEPGHDQHYPGVVRTLNELVFPKTTDHHHINCTWSGRLI